MNKFQELYDQYMSEAKGDGHITHFRDGLDKIPEEYAGKTINGNFDLGQNNLKDLTNGPAVVTGHYSANDNKLTSLKGAPKSANRFSIDNNEDLGSLGGISDNKYPTFSCANCGLTDLGGLPKTKMLDVSNNPLTSLDGLERNKKYARIQVTGTQFKYSDVEEYCEANGISFGRIDD